MLLSVCADANIVSVTFIGVNGPQQQLKISNKNSHCLMIVKMCVTAAHCEILSMASDSMEELISDRKNLEHTRKWLELFNLSLNIGF